MAAGAGHPAAPSAWLVNQEGAHEAAIAWLGSLGHVGASRCYLSGLTPRTACVLSSTSALAHLRLGVPLTGPGALQELVADARGRQLQLFYFTSGTYSETALAYAETFGIALFTYDRAGVLSHANAAALTALLAAPDVAPPPQAPKAARHGASDDAGPSLSAAQEPGLRAWALSAWQARQASAPGRAFLAFLPLGVSVLAGLLTLAIVRAWQTGAGPTLSVAFVIVAVMVFHALCVWGAWRVARWYGQVRQHRLRVMQACRPPMRARALVHGAMQQSGRGVPHDREALVLLRNEVIELSGVDAFTAGVLVWEVTIGAARSADRHEWVGAPPSEHPATH